MDLKVRHLTTNLRREINKFTMKGLRLSDAYRAIELLIDDLHREAGTESTNARLRKALESADEGCRFMHLYEVASPAPPPDAPVAPTAAPPGRQPG